MSKDLEKQNKKLEKQNKKLKKKGKRAGIVIFVLLLIILVMFLVVFLFDPLGFGNGMGILMQKSPSAQPSITTIAPQTEEPEESAVTVIDVRVSGGTYFMDGSETSVENIISAAKAVTGDLKVSVTDDSATANAMDALTAELEKNSVPYTIG